MSFFKELVLSVYVYYRKRNESFVAAFHTRAIVSLVLLIYFTVLFLFLKGIANIQALSNVDIMKNKVTYIGVLVFFYLIVQFLGGTNDELEQNREEANRAKRTGFFVFSIIGVLLLFFVVPYVS